MHRAAAAWTGTGECVVAVIRRSKGGPLLPPEFRPVAGPQLVVAANYLTSPVGPYLELGVAEPARFGARAGMCVTTMVAGSPAAVDAGREHWGFPKELGSLQWSVDGDTRTLTWEERGLVMVGIPTRVPLPGFLPYRSLQRRADGPVLVGGMLRGSARAGRVDVTVPAGDPLVDLAGRHRGALVRDASVRMGNARPLR